MRALDIFMVVLIAAGTWSPAMTQDPSTIREKMVQEVQEALKNVNPASVSELEAKFEEIRRRITKECERNGGATAYDDLVKGLLNFASCAQMELDVQAIGDDIASSYSKNNWKPFFDKNCPKFSVPVNCITNLTDSIKPCLGREERDLANAFKNILRLTLEFICHDGGDAIASFVSTDGLKCLNSSTASLNKCQSEVENDPHFEKIFNESITSSTTGIPILNLDQEACESIDQWQTCFVGVFQKCENPKSADALDVMFTTFEKLTNCKNSASSSYGSANSSVISLVSGLLITTAMSMYSRF